MSRKIIRNLLITVIFMSIAALFLNNKVPDRPNGFKGYGWGTKLQEIRKKVELEFVSHDDHMNTAVFSSNIMEWRGLHLTACNFMFYEDKFYAVSMVVSGRDKSKQLMGIMETDLGEGRELGFGNRHTWETISCLGKFYFDEEHDQGIFDLMSPLYSVKINRMIANEYLSSFEGRY